MTLLDLEHATTPLSGTNRQVPSRVKIKYEPRDIVVGTPGEHTWLHGSEIFPETTFAGSRLHEQTLLSRRRYADTADLIILVNGSPLNLNARGLDQALAVFEAKTRLIFQTVDADWRNLTNVIEPSVLPEPVAAPEPLGPLQAFHQLRDWLGLTDAETADLVGVGRTTPYTWRTRIPQAKRARRLFETHALVESLVERLGVSQTRDAVRRGGSGSVLTLVKKGRVAEAEDLFADVIFGVAEAGPSPFALRAEERGDDPAPPLARARATTPSSRRSMTATRRR